MKHVYVDEINWAVDSVGTTLQQFSKEFNKEISVNAVDDGSEANGTTMEEPRMEAAALSPWNGT